MPLPTRTLLSDVPQVHFYDGGEQSPEDVPFPSCLAASLRFLGEEYPWLTKTDKGRTTRDNYAFIYILAHSGMAFGLRWRDGWHMDNVDHMMVADPGEVIRRAFAAVGYTYEIVHKTGSCSDEACWRQRVKESLNAGKPVLAFGVIGPPECCLIAGHDECGHVAVGWNFFQKIPPFTLGLEYEPTGQFRKRDWFQDTWSMILLGEKTGRPELAQLNRDTLRWALQIARTPKVFDHHTGHAAYAVWANQLADELLFNRGHSSIQQKYDAHNNVVGMLAECRWWAAQWLRYIAPGDPAMAEHLLAAAACYEAEHDLMWKVWGAVGGNGHPDAPRAFELPEVRREIAGYIREAQQQDISAAAHLERALQAG